MEKIKNYGVRIAVFGGVQFIILTLLAMFLFPGGTIQNPEAGYYLFFENFFSDLGRTEDFQGNSNWISMSLFSFALAVLGTSLIIFFIAIPNLFSKNDNRIKLIVYSISLIGMLAGLCFIGVAFTPWDILFEAHVFFVRIGFRLLLLTCILIAILIHKTSYFPSRYAYAIVFVSIILTAYIILLTYGPKPGESLEGLMIQVAGQKIVVYLLISGIMYLAIGADKVRKHLKEKGGNHPSV